jgi:hypothetical protein
LGFGHATPEADRKAIARIEAPQPDGRQVMFWDQDLKGFGVLASGKTNSKTFIAQRDLPNGKTRRITIASVSEMTLIKAREQARTVLVDTRGLHLSLRGLM